MRVLTPLRRWEVASALVAWALIAQLGCDNELVHLPLPPLEDARTLILAVDGEAVSVHDLAAGPVRFIDYPAAPRRALDAWVYLVPPSALGLSAGDLPIDPSGTSLRTPADAFSLDLAPAARIWVREQPAVSTLWGLHFPRRNPCASFRISALPISESEAGVLASAPLGAGRVLVALTNDELWTITASSSSPVTRVGVPGDHISGLAPAPNGGVLIGLDAGELWSGALVGDELRATRWGPTAPGPRMLVQTSSAEVFVVNFDPATHASELGRSDGHAYQGVSTFNGPGPGNNLFGGLLSRGPGAVIAGRSTAPFLVFTSSGSSSRLVPSSDSFDGISALADLPGWGLVIGTVHGNLLVSRNGSYVPLVALHEGESILALGAFEDGIFFSTVNAHFGYYRPPEGLCFGTEELLPTVAVRILPTGDGRWLFVGQRIGVGSGPPLAGLVERVP
ncbi:MAG: hypothetical protein U1E65_20980 [Myxococcota bacterium]